MHSPWGGPEDGWLQCPEAAGVVGKGGEGAQLCRETLCYEAAVRESRPSAGTVLHASQSDLFLLG